MAFGTRLKMYFRLTHSPIKTLAELTGQPQKLMPSLGWMLLFRVPLAWAACLISYTWVDLLQKVIMNPPAALTDLAGKYSIQAKDAMLELRHLPTMPPIGVAWPWAGLFALLGVICLWMHNVAWDHLSLWILRGVRPKPSLRASGIAIAEAMGAASFGAVFGLLAGVPIVGFFALPLVMIAGIYYWALRGLSLAKFHECPLWKGMAAIMLHVFLAIMVYGAMFLLAGLFAASFAFAFCLS